MDLGKHFQAVVSLDVTLYVDSARSRPVYRPGKSKLSSPQKTQR